MGRFTFLFFLPIIAGYVASGQSRPLPSDSAFRLMDAGNYGKAITLINSMIESDSTNADLYEWRGIAYEGIKDYQSAIFDYSRSLVADPAHWSSYLKRADLLTAFEYYDDALKDYDAALQWADTTSAKESILVNRASLKKKMKDTEGAVADLKQALKINDKSLAALGNLGALLFDMGKPSEAINSLQKAIEIDSTFEGGYGNLAFLYAQMGDYKKALSISNKLLQMKPNEAYALNNRGYIRYNLEDYTGALEDINNSIQLDPQNSFAFKNRGLVYIALHKNAEACADFQRALSLGFTRDYGTEVESLQEKYCQPKSDAVRGL